MKRMFLMAQPHIEQNFVAPSVDLGTDLATGALVDDTLRLMVGAFGFGLLQLHILMFSGRKVF
jgi:hypothetical protein